MNSNTTQMISLVLDLAYDCEGIDEGLATFLAEVPFVTEATVLLASGPAGWPFVRFTLPADKLGAFAEAYGIDEDELLEHAITNVIQSALMYLWKRRKDRT